VLPREVEGNQEIQQWTAEGHICDLLPKLIEGGFITMSSIQLIDMGDLVAMGITKSADQSHLLLAVQQAMDQGPDMLFNVHFFFLKCCK
jgi:hypothetical protein